MDEAEISLKGNIKGKKIDAMSKLKTKFEELGFTSIECMKDKLVIEKIETTDLKGKTKHFYRACFYPNKFDFVYSLGMNRKKREFETLGILMDIIKVAEDNYTINAADLYSSVTVVLNELRPLMDSEFYVNTQQVSELREKYSSLEKKYRDLVLSSEKNARILLECEKKRDEYYTRIKQLEGISDDVLTREIFKWLKTHSGEINIFQFAKAYSIQTTRVEEGLARLLENGYIRRIGK